METYYSGTMHGIFKEKSEIDMTGQKEEAKKKAVGGKVKKAVIGQLVQ